MSLTDTRPLQEVLSGMAVASAELLSQRSLQRRHDSKFVLHRRALPALFSLLQPHYAVVHANQNPIARYDNQYFDSLDHRLLREHHRGRVPRYKLRIRHYADRGLSFVESKKKLASGVTQKSKQAIPPAQRDLTGLDAFVRANIPLSLGALVPSITTTFRRITIVHPEEAERATCDIDVLFQHNSRQKHLTRGAIVEIKQLHRQPRSPLMLALKQVGARKLSISKYCTAGFFLLPSVPMNLYRPTIHSMRKAFCD